MGFTKVASVNEIQPGAGKPVEVKGKMIALFNVGGQFFAIDNTCPHMEGPLGEGTIYEDDTGPGVICPWHGYMFNIKSGEGINFPTGVKKFDVKIEGSDVLVNVE